MFIINNKTLWLFESDLAGKENSIYKVASTKEFNQGIYMIIFLLLGETKLNKKTYTKPSRTWSHEEAARESHLCNINSDLTAFLSVRRRLWSRLWQRQQLTIMAT